MPATLAAPRHQCVDASSRPVAQGCTQSPGRACDPAGQGDRRKPRWHHRPAVGLKESGDKANMAATARQLPRSVPACHSAQCVGRRAWAMRQCIGPQTSSCAASRSAGLDSKLAGSAPMARKGIAVRRLASTSRQSTKRGWVPVPRASDLERARAAPARAAQGPCHGSSPGLGGVSGASLQKPCAGCPGLSGRRQRSIRSGSRRTALGRRSDGGSRTSALR